MFDNIPNCCKNCEKCKNNKMCWFAMSEADEEDNNDFIYVKKTKNVKKVKNISQKIE